MYSNEQLLQSKTYSPEEIREATLIIHPKNFKKYKLITDAIAQVFEEGSNFTALKNPIVDEYGNQYRDSEGYYMAQRIEDLNIKKLIAFSSFGFGLSKKMAYRYEGLLDKNPIQRIEYMRKAIKQKFDNNSDLQALLLQTNNRQIIEYTYRGDRFFGINNDNNTGANILGKLLMEYRDKIKQT